MAFPTKVGAGTATSQGSVVHHKVDMPGTVVAGELLVAVGGFSRDLAAGDFTPPTGWGRIYTGSWQSDTDPTHNRIAESIFTKVATGSEAGKTLTFDTAIQAYSSWVVHRIAGAGVAVVGTNVLFFAKFDLAPECPTDAVAASRGSHDYLFMSTYSRLRAEWDAAWTPPAGYTVGKHAEATMVATATAFNPETTSQIAPSSGASLFWTNEPAAGDAPAAVDVQVAFATS